MATEQRPDAESCPTPPQRRRSIIAGAAVVLLAMAAVAVYILGNFGAIGVVPQTYPPLDVAETVGADYFSEDYVTARSKFREAVLSAGGKLDSIPHPTAEQRAQEPLSVEVGFFEAPDPDKFLVIISGTHGVEGFAGSAIQAGLLEEEIVAKALKNDINVLMIHALNPFGMANRRRFNEDNIDLNRNFLDHRKPHPRNENYDAIAAAIAPESVSFWSEVGSWLRLLWYRTWKGNQATQTAISQGQYHHARGLFFGGNSAAWSNKTLGAITHKYLAAAKQVLVVDVHTGLGDFGDYEIIMNDRDNSASFQRARSIWGDRRVKSTVAASSDDIRSESAHVTGTLKRGIAGNLQMQVTAVGLEFGTLPKMVVFKALRAENWAHHHGQDDPRTEEIKECLLRAFYPDSADWKTRVWLQGRDVIQQAIDWLADDTK